jgi:hypothetical protein
MREEKVDLNLTPRLTISPAARYNGTFGNFGLRERRGLSQVPASIDRCGIFGFCGGVTSMKIPVETIGGGSLFKDCLKPNSVLPS